MSIHAVTRMTGTSKNTAVKLLVDAGAACQAYPDENVRHVKAYNRTDRYLAGPISEGVGVASAMSIGRESGYFVTLYVTQEASRA